MGGPVHSRSRSGNWQGHHQKRPRQDASGSQGKAEKGHRGKHRHRLWAGQDLHGGNMAGGLDGELRQGETQTVHVQDQPRFSEKPHQAADRRHPVGRPDFSGLAAILQTSVGRRAGRPRRGQEKAERVSTENRSQHPSDDRLSVQPRRGTAPRHKKSHARLRLAKGGAQGDENLDRRPTQRLLPGGQGQRCVRALLPRPRHRPAPGRTAGAKVDRCRPRPWRAENPKGHFQTERQGGRGTVKNEKRLSNAASVGRRDQRSENAKVQGEQRRMGISVPNRRPHVTGQCVAYAPTSTKASRAAPHPIS